MTIDDDRAERALGLLLLRRAWLPFVLSLLTTLLSLGVLWGSLGGRLNLIEYRLQQIELRLKIGP